jgi:hypothetical protein
VAARRTSGVTVAVGGPGMGEWLALASSVVLAVQVLLPDGLGNGAGVICLLESVFAAAPSILWGYDRVTHPLALGGRAHCDGGAAG